MNLCVLFLLHLILVAGVSFCDVPGFVRIWGDDFDNGNLDPISWDKDVRGPGDSRTRDAAATADNVWVENGTLVLQSSASWTGTAWVNLTSGAVQTQGKHSWSGLTRVCVSAKCALPPRPPTTPIPAAPRPYTLVGSQSSTVLLHLVRCRRSSQAAR